MEADVLLQEAARINTKFSGGFSDIADDPEFGEAVNHLKGIYDQAVKAILILGCLSIIHEPKTAKMKQDEASFILVNRKAAVAKYPYFVAALQKVLK